MERFLKESSETQPDGGEIMNLLDSQWQRLSLMQKTFMGSDLFGCWLSVFVVYRCRATASEGWVKPFLSKIGKCKLVLICVSDNTFHSLQHQNEKKKNSNSEDFHEFTLFGFFKQFRTELSLLSVFVTPYRTDHKDFISKRPQFESADDKILLLNQTSKHLTAPQSITSNNKYSSEPLNPQTPLLEPLKCGEKCWRKTRSVFEGHFP